MEKLSLLSNTETLYLAEICPPKPHFSTWNNGDGIDTLDACPLLHIWALKGLIIRCQSWARVTVWPRFDIKVFSQSSFQCHGQLLSLRMFFLLVTLKEELMPGPAQRASRPHCWVNASWPSLAQPFLYCLHNLKISKCSRQVFWIGIAKHREGQKTEGVFNT